jgi:hypothetical protein
MTYRRPTSRQHSLAVAALQRCGVAIVSGAPAYQWLWTDARTTKLQLRGWDEMSRRDVTELIRAARAAACD